MIKKTLEKGSLSISEDVFSFIASIVINEMEYIESTVSDIKENIFRVVSRKGNHKGIIVNQKEDEVSLDIKISVYLGTNICDLCYLLQQKIAEEIEIMTGVKVVTVNVFVDSVQIK